MYAKYYFDLRTLADQNDLTFPAEPLSKDRAQRLEVRKTIPLLAIILVIAAIKYLNIFSS